MFGPSLLVAPVFVPEGEESEYYLPAGRWTSFFHPERVIVGPTWVREVVPMDDIPVWVRPNTILPLGPAGLGRPDYNLSSGLEVRLYELAEGAKVSAAIPTGNGTEMAGTIVAERVNGEVKVAVIDGHAVMATVVVYLDGKEKSLTVEMGSLEVKITV